MWQSLLKLLTIFSLTTSFVAYCGVVVDSTRYVYKEGSREISAHLENKDEIPYLIKSWVEPSEGNTMSSFMVTPPLFRLEAKQKNTLRIFPNANIASAPKDRDTVYFFNVMSIPPTSADEADKNKLQLAVRHRMRLIYRPKSILDLSVINEAKKIEWRKSANKIIVKNTTPFFIYFRSVTVNGKELVTSIPHIEAFSSQSLELPVGTSATEIKWKIATDNGGTSSVYSSHL